MVATLSLFGRKRGVGVDTISEFFARVCLDTPVGCSPSAVRRVRQRLEDAVLETAQTWEREGITHGEVRASIGAVDEPFVTHLMLVLQDVSTGDLLLEPVPQIVPMPRGKPWWTSDVRRGDRACCPEAVPGRRPGCNALPRGWSACVCRRSFPSCMRSSSAMRSPWVGACGKRARPSSTLRRARHAMERGPTQRLTGQKLRPTWKPNTPRGSTGRRSNVPTGPTSQPAR